MANSVLGPADADALFDRAIDVLKSCRCELGFIWPGASQASSTSSWPRILKASLRWAIFPSCWIGDDMSYVRPDDRDDRTSHTRCVASAGR